MDQEEGISAEEQARQRLKSKQPARQSLIDDEKQLKRVEARFRTGTQIQCKHQNIEVQVKTVETCKWRERVVTRRSQQRRDKCSVSVG